jgi:hypothetical protein
VPSLLLLFDFFDFDFNVFTPQNPQPHGLAPTPTAPKTAFCAPAKHFLNFFQKN